jgi:chaperonin GroES
MNLQPLNGHVLLRLVEAEEKTKGGLYVPDSAREQPAEGYVEAKSSGSSDEIAIGDRVVYKKYSGEEISLDGTKYRLIQEGELLAKYVEADAIPG